MNNDFTNSDPLAQGIVVESPELNTGLGDEELNQIIDSRISESKTAYELLKLDERRKKNEDYWKGKQVKDDEVTGLPYIDNVIQDNTEKRIAMASGKMPDIEIVPGDNSLMGRQKTEVLERVLDIDISNKEKRRLVKNGLRHNMIYFLGIQKASWNPNKGQFGDYEFNLCDPRKVLISHTGIIPEDGFTVDNCDLIVEVVEEPVAVVMAKFPAKAQQLKELLGSNDGSRLATTMKYQEGWYTYYNAQGQILEGVFWRYNHLILRNIKNPYFDFTGYDRVLYDDQGVVKTDALGQTQTERVFRNFFDRPRKPYILYSYTNLGRSPMDDTTAIEQAIPLQRNLNKTGKQIRDISDGITNKYAFNNSISQDQARLVSANPKEPIWLDNDQPVSNQVSNFQNAGPPAVLFQELMQTRQQIDAKFSVHNLNQASQGIRESGISRQITRENDLITTDDIASIVVERVTEETGAWAIQFMKLMYVDAHFKSKMGKDGQIIQEYIQRDMIDDGISISVRGSIADKQTARNQAINLGTSGAIDPMTMMEEIDAPNPKERTERLLKFKMGEGPNGDGFASYMEMIGITMQPDQQQQAQDQGQPQLDQNGQPVNPNAGIPIQAPAPDLQPLQLRMRAPTLGGNSPLNVAR